MATTQEHLLIKDIRDDVVILKDGSMAIVIKTSAVNFGLLSENEQYAIISSFAGMLNSLSFAIQIVIRSKRLDITKYLDSLEQARKKQPNQLLSQMIERYRAFIRETVRDNQVLDKQFFIVIPLSYIEIGLIKDREMNFKKAMTLLLPRKDHIIRQLSRTGLRADQLTGEELVKLFYDIYNEPAIAPVLTPEQVAQQQTPLTVPLPTPQQPIQRVAPQPAPVYQPQVAPGPVRPQVQPAARAYTPPQAAPQPQVRQTYQQQSSVANPQPFRRNPFVVEELADDYGTV